MVNEKEQKIRARFGFSAARRPQSDRLLAYYKNANIGPGGDKDAFFSRDRTPPLGRC